MRRLFAQNEAQAQEFCDRAHAHRKAENPAYKADVDAGRVLAWGSPQRAMQPDPLNPLRSTPTGDWFVEVDDGCLGAFLASELKGLE